MEQAAQEAGGGSGTVGTVSSTPESAAPARPNIVLIMADDLGAKELSCYGHEKHEAWFRKAWARTGKKLDMGKSCVRFRSADDLDLDLAQSVSPERTASLVGPRKWEATWIASRPSKRSPVSFRT